MKQKSIKAMEQELAALAGTKPAPELSTKQDGNDNLSEDYLNFERHPITDDERKEFDRAVAEYNRRRHGLQGDPDPDNPDAFVATQRTVQRMLRHLEPKTK